MGKLNPSGLGMTKECEYKAVPIERVLMGVVGVCGILNGLVLTHKDVAGAVCASVGAAALLGALVIACRSWWLERKDPKPPNKPNYNRTPYV